MVIRHPLYKRVTMVRLQTFNHTSLVIMLTLKTLHVVCAYTTGLGFLLRGLLVIFNSPLRHYRLTKTLPHIIDSGLFISGLLMFYSWDIPLTSLPWLMAKLTALLIYIGCGLWMIRWGTTDTRRKCGLIAGLAVYAYIIGAAHTKSVFSLLIFL